MQLNTYRDQVIRRLEIDCYITHFSFSFLFVRWQKGGLTAKQRAGHRGGVPDGFYKDGSLVWNVILWTVHHRCQLWLKHLVGSHVHIGDSTTEPERRPRHGEPARCYGGPPGLPGAGHRANPWNGRGLASSLITSYLPCHSTVIAASSLPRISKVEAQIVYNKCIERNIFQVIFLKLFIRKCKILYMFYFHQGLQLLSFFFCFALDICSLLNSGRRKPVKLWGGWEPVTKWKKISKKWEPKNELNKPSLEYRWQSSYVAQLWEHLLSSVWLCNFPNSFQALTL